MLTFTIYLCFANIFVTTFAASGSTDEELLRIIKDLQAESKEFRQKLVSLEEKILSQNEYIRQQDKRIESLEMIIKSQENASNPRPAYGEHDLNGDSLERMSKSQLKKTEKRVPTSLSSTIASTPVAFQALLSHDTSHITEHQVIVFDTVVTNIGGGYHSYHGLFTAPKAGIYIFASSLLLQPDSSIEGQIMKNGQAIQGVFAYSQGHGSFVQGSGSAVVQLGVGDEVWVETTEWSKDASLRQGDYTSFMGCLIFEL